MHEEITCCYHHKDSEANKGKLRKIKILTNITLH